MSSRRGAEHWDSRAPFSARPLSVLVDSQSTTFRFLGSMGAPRVVSICVHRRKASGLTFHSFQAFPKKLVAFSTWIDRTRWARNTWAMLAIFILVMANTVDMVSSRCPSRDTPCSQWKRLPYWPAQAACQPCPSTMRHRFAVALGS